MDVGWNIQLNFQRGKVNLPRSQILPSHVKNINKKIHSVVSHKLNQSSSGISAELANLNGLDKAACTVLLTWIKDVWPVFLFDP